MKVLIVEDSKVISNAIRIILEQEGILAFETADGSKVVETVKKLDIDLVILDLMMPSMSGEEVYNMLKKDRKTKNTKIMILTARIDALKRNETLKGCDKFMAKPFDNKELVSEVKKLLDQK
jgi:DNA-binding response OmpR family regulator